jgi:hypothetical protein
MSELYKEALAEAKKIKEMAEEDAKRKIIEEVTPYIKKMIVNESMAFFTEEDDINQAEGEELASSAPISPKGESQADLSKSMPDVEMTEKPAGTGGDPLGIMSKTLEDLVGAEGKITIDPSGKITIETDSQSGMNSPVVGMDSPDPTSTELGAGALPPAELGAPPATPPAPPPAPMAGDPMPPGSPGGQMDMQGAPAPMPPEQDPTMQLPPAQLTENYKSFKVGLGEVALKIDEAYFAKKPSNVLNESLKQKLFTLLEQLDRLKESGQLNRVETRLNEKKLEFLFQKLKESNLSNSYSKINKGNRDMGSLKEFASKLFESDETTSLAQDSQSGGKTGVPVKRAASEHAMEVSGVSPEVDDLFMNEDLSLTIEDLEGEALEGSGDADEMPWEDGQTLAEEIEALGHAGFGDSSEKPSAEPFVEISDAELMEAVRSLRKSKEQAWEDAEPEGGEDPSLKNLDENLVLTLSLPDDLDLDPADVSVDVSSDDGDDMDMDMDDEDEDMDMDDEDMDMDDEEEEDEEGLELLYDDEDEDSDSESLELDADEEEEDEDGGVETFSDSYLKEAVRRSATRKSKLLESKLQKTLLTASKVQKLAESRKRELLNVKSEMAETNLFLSKVLLLNKFLQREDLSAKQKQAIVEHLDRARTIAEAKDVYVKIKNKLNEVAKRSETRTIGSASAPVQSGAASFKLIAESSNQGDVVLGTPERWALLVKGRKDD